jgi:hypothetical protein
MATAIKITPIISGEASKRFNRMLAAAGRKKTSSREKIRIKKSVTQILKNNPVSSGK